MNQFTTLINLSTELQELEGTAYNIQMNNDGTFTLFDGNSFTADYNTIHNFLYAALHERCEHVYGSLNSYLDFPPDGYYYDYEGQVDAMLCDGIYK
jgi:hypothetical protein